MRARPRHSSPQTPCCCKASHARAERASRLLQEEEEEQRHRPSPPRPGCPRPPRAASTSPRSARTAGAPSAATTRWRGTSRTSTSSRTRCTCASSVTGATGPRTRSPRTRASSTGARAACWRGCSRRRRSRACSGAGLPCSRPRGCTSDSSRVPDARCASARPNNRLLQPQVQIYYRIFTMQKIISEEEHIYSLRAFFQNCVSPRVCLTLAGAKSFRPCSTAVRELRHCLPQTP